MSKSTKTNHYTYIIRHVNGRYYVGRRSTKKDPLLDSYMGSGKWVKSIKDRSTITKDIIAYYDTFEELKVAEMELIEKYFLDVYCMNVAYSSCGAASGDKHHMYGKTGEKNPMYGKTGELSPMYGRTGDKHPQFGKRGEGTPCFGRTGELHPMYNKTHTNQTKQRMSDAKRGEKAYQATITDHIARLIKIRISEGAKDRPISEEYNTTTKVVSHIRYNKSWKYITT
jgi:NUMOD3 motif/Spt5 C-terminal nonapeptide repeat binding Spt4